MCYVGATKSSGEPKYLCSSKGVALKRFNLCPSLLTFQMLILKILKYLLLNALVVKKLNFLQPNFGNSFSLL